MSASKACAYFARGSCSKGANCAFLHPPGPETRRSPSPSNPAGARTPCSFYQHGDCKNSKCNFSHSAPPAPAGPGGRKPCIYYQRGNCTNSKCTFLHSVDQRETREDMDDTTTRTMLGCTATLTSGLRVTKVSLDLESTCVIISNLPEDVEEAALQKILRPIGEHKISLMLKALRPMARVEFETPSLASSAVAAVDKKSFHGHVITARLAPRRESGEGVLRDKLLQVTWDEPTATAFAYFSNRRQAQLAAEKFDGSPIRGKMISTKFQVPKPNQRALFSVVITNLIEDVTKPEIIKLIKCDDVTIQQPPFLHLASFARLSEALEVGGPGTLESVNHVPTLPSDPKLKATAVYAVADQAEKAVETLHGKKFDFLNNSPLWLSRTPSVKFSLKREQFLAIEPRLTSIEAEHSGTEFDFRKFVDEKSTKATLRVTAPDARSLGQLKLKIERLFRGEIIFDEDNNVWDEELLTQKGRIIIGDIAQSKGVYARCDPIKQHILLFAPDDSTGQEVRKRILSRVNKMRNSRRSFKLNRSKFGVIMRCGLETLRERYGQESAKVNIKKFTLSVSLKSDTDFKWVEDFVRGLAESVRSWVVGGVKCPICLGSVTGGLTLSCGHEYCGRCLDHMFQSASFPFTCLAEECGVPIRLSIIKARLGSSVMENLLDLAMETYIKEHPEEYRFCPTSDCAHIYVPGPGNSVHQCKGCLTEICTSCHVEAHAGLTCAERQELCDPIERVFTRWKAENDVRPCSRCRVPIQKKGGCNHMTCSICKADVCWVCMGLFDADTIYPHLEKVHGKV
ncbi:uncharacterized protein EI90DRAFT_3013700 [Cantharellus anzutake]|uniref:uncharacterized protein n=1 Tax=Cantharellus anzutake TaxID=1750568 RepID=UPI0019069813|nr:uncharacterized protein EI90DRAFT_3013700 [Cantharellus anzutake]KAF8337493.1 hypothetical protein EI90DRAFT_3013700 [Cantharellus anzutake]